MKPAVPKSYLRELTKPTQSQIDFEHRDGHRTRLLQEYPHCFYCNKLLDKYTVTLDHVIPKSLGGKSDKTNYVLACKECNEDKDQKIYIIRPNPWFEAEI